MNLLEIYKEAYYKELEYMERLNSKIGTSITFMTIIGTANIYILNKVTGYKLGHEILPTLVTILTIFCLILFVCTCWLFYKTYSGYVYEYFPVKDFNDFIVSCKEIEEYTKEEIYDYINSEYTEIFCKMSINNQDANIHKSKAHLKFSNTLVINLICLALTYGLLYIQ